MTELGWHHASHEGDSTSLPSITQTRCIRCEDIAMSGVLVRISHGFKVHFGGDSAMGPLFGQTGHKYGPSDLMR